MKKLLILILICFVQTMFSQNTKSSFKEKTSKTKNTESAIIEVNPHQEALYEPDASQKVSKKTDNLVYNTAGIETKPEFPGGLNEFYKFIAQTYSVPKEKPINIKGKVYATFIIEKDGSLSEIKILRDIGYGTGKEAIRVLKLSPKWIPGKLNNTEVRVLYSIPININ